MNRLQLKRVYETPDATDGKRVLVDRLWPRGLRKDAVALDLWAKEVAPTPELRKWFGHDPARFEEFSARYRLELDENPAASAFAEQVATWLADSPVTLLFAAKDPAVNHAVVLRDWLENR